MGDHLDGFAEIVAAAFLRDDGLVNLSGGNGVRAGKRAAREALVVAEVEVGFRAVVEHVDFAVLVGTHRSRVDVQIRVELLDAHFQSAQLEQGPERRRRQAFSEGRNNAACYKDVFHRREHSV